MGVHLLSSRGFEPRTLAYVDNTSMRNFTGSPRPPSHLLLSGSPPLAARAVSAHLCAALVPLDVA